jgi:hypothetical protein
MTRALRLRALNCARSALTSVRYCVFVFGAVLTSFFSVVLYDVHLHTDALANHGLIKRNGRGISLWRLRAALRDTLNTSWTLALDITNGVEKRFGGKNVINLECVQSFDFQVGLGCSSVRDAAGSMR